MKTTSRILSAWLLAATAGASLAAGPTYTVVGTGQTRCYDNRREIAPPKPGEPFYGHAAQHRGVAPSYRDDGDGTITDRATGLMWSKADSGQGLNWEQALAYAASVTLAGHTDWRLPNAKELQSLVDYTRAPAVTQSPAIDPLFQTSQLSDGEYPFFWSSTTHLDGPPDRQGDAAVYVMFGRGLGWMQFPPGRGEFRLLDVHGAGAQRSDPKAGDPARFPHGRGPQGDVIRISNYVRVVRGAGGARGIETPP
jgi:hypothetical protein